jgi:NAD+ kinase
MSRSLGLVLHAHRPEAPDLARRVLDWAESHDIEVHMVEPDAGLIGRPELAVSPAVFPVGLDAVLSVGGDGTMLRAVSLVADAGVPVAGVNAGQLGYLTEIDPAHLDEALTSWLHDELAVDERMLLEARVERADGTAGDRWLALNEVVVEKARSGHTIHLAVAIDGRFFTTYLADGIIVATPTGSTAYSFSARGPIVEPDFSALVLTPVAAHGIFDRSLVLAPSTEVRLVVGGYRDAAVAIDGQTKLDLAPGDALVCRGAEQRARILRLGERNFHAVLKEKFGLSDR